MLPELEEEEEDQLPTLDLLLVLALPALLLLEDGLLEGAVLLELNEPVRSLVAGFFSSLTEEEPVELFGVLAVEYPLYGVELLLWLESYQPFPKID